MIKLVWENIDSFILLTMRTKKFQPQKGLGHDRYNWWFESNQEHSFCVYDIDSFYQADYFKRDHVSEKVVKGYCDYVLDYGKAFLCKDIKTILELGCGSGWFTLEFLKRGIDIFAVEGTSVGYQKALERGIPSERLLQHDLRLPLNLKKSFDMVLCTEVAEHIEPPFSSQLIFNIISHSKLVWFSFESPETNEAHYHHPNEQPEIFWRNLFNFYDYDFLKLNEWGYTEHEIAHFPIESIAELVARGRYIAGHKNMQIKEISDGRKHNIREAKGSDSVKIHFTCRAEDGEMFASSIGATPLIFRIGTNQVFSALEQAIIGMRIGEFKAVRISSDRAFGSYDQNKVIRIKRDQLPGNIQPHIGLRFLH